MIERWLTGWIDGLDLRFEVGEDELAAQLRPPGARRDDVQGRAVLLVWWAWAGLAAPRSEDETPN